MIISINPNELIGMKYDKDNFHCYNFLEKVYGENIPNLKDVAVNSAKDDINQYKELFSEIKYPTAYCVAVLGDKHIGIYKNSHIYHNDIDGVRCENVRAMKLKYKDIKYYDICKN